VKRGYTEMENKMAMEFAKNAAAGMAGADDSWLP